MSRFTFSQDDILRSVIVKEPAFYSLEIYDVEDRPAKSDNGESTNTIIKFRIMSGEGKPYNGVPVDQLFSEKAMGMAIPFVEALGVKVTPGASIDLTREKLVGKKVLGYIKMELTNNNNPRNVIKEFKPIGGK